MKIICIICFFLVLTLNCAAQDTTIYAQTHGGWFYNCYMFIRDSASATRGSFFRLMGSDAPPRFFGKGSFQETKKEIILNQYYLVKEEEIIDQGMGRIINVDSLKNIKTDIVNEKFIKEPNSILSIKSNLPLKATEFEIRFVMAKTRLFDIVRNRILNTLNEDWINKIR